MLCFITLRHEILQQAGLSSILLGYGMLLLHYTLLYHVVLWYTML